MKRGAIADSYSLIQFAEIASEREAMRSLTSLHEGRAYGPQNF